MAKTINLVFPHQLFLNSPLLENGHEIYLIEEHLFFRQYDFHKQKIAFHRASMKYYEERLQLLGKKVTYISSHEEASDIRLWKNRFNDNEITEIHVIDPTDDWLMRRLKVTAGERQLVVHENPLFINTTQELASFFKEDKKFFFQTVFYKQQRKKRKILVDNQNTPQGGKWTYDTENRKKYPKGKLPPPVHFPAQNKYWAEAVAYTSTNFGQNPGDLDNNRYYPITHDEAEQWLEDFFEKRFHEFGPYEDAIVREHSILNHSVLSPLINVGLLLPLDVVTRSISFADQHSIPINSLEGFVRQVMGWREFIRGMYITKGVHSRNQNYWNFDRRMPKSFYNGSTGIPPIDQTIKKVLKTGYCHHIERLMILGNFMVLCEIHPDEVYQWFMELFIDAYDWVMVPNVYGMSQFADGGLFATKPYISGSNYIRKMSNYTTGEWTEVWDGLFWRFIGKYENTFSSNSRMAMMVSTYNRMSDDKKTRLLDKAENFLSELKSVQ